ILEDGRTALLVPAGEPGPLAEAVTRLMDDPTRRREIGSAGAALVHARYSGARLAERLTALYLSLAVASGQPSS
ncbi:MAG: glycosyltransferase, partial [Acidobacteriia bacterium]|nr:glycosyltransferase [Terriglobia bacterium]